MKAISQKVRKEEKKEEVTEMRKLVMGISTGVFEIGADGGLLSKDKQKRFEPEYVRVLRQWEGGAEVEFECSPAPCPWRRETGSDCLCAWNGNEKRPRIIGKNLPAPIECLWCQLYGNAPVFPEC